MGEYIPLYISIVLTIIVGIVMPAIVIPFTDAGVQSEGGYTNTSYFDNDGVYNATGQLDTDSITSGKGGLRGIIDSLSIYIDSFKYIPPVVLAPLLIIISAGYAYTIIRMITLA